MGPAELGSLSVVLPVFNEEACLRSVLEDTASYLRRTFERHELIVVDDGSTDRSADIIREAAGKDGRILLLSHGGNEGYGRALRTGIRAARMEYVFLMDADGQFRIEDLRLLLPGLASGAAVVGCRAKRQDPWPRVLLGAAFTKSMNLCFGLGFKDINCAFKLLRREDAQALDLLIDGPLINAEMLVKLLRRGLRIEERPVPHYPRLAGQATGAKVSTLLRALRDFIRLTFSLSALRRGLRQQP